MTDIRSFEGSYEARFGDYVQLLKPRVMSLVVFTAATGLIVAPGSVNPLVAAIAILCIAVGAGAAGALAGVGRAAGAMPPSRSSSGAGAASAARDFTERFSARGAACAS